VTFGEHYFAIKRKSIRKRAFMRSRPLFSAWSSASKRLAGRAGVGEDKLWRVIYVTTGL